MTNKFWQTKQLDEMSQNEWESLCDGCGLCCLHKLEDEDTDQVYYTKVACKLLDLDRCRCTNYPQRQDLVSDCLVLTAKDIEKFHWLPSTCAYRLIADGKALLDWHPLISGNSHSVHHAGISAKGRAVSESEADITSLEEHIIHWVS